MYWLSLGGRPEHAQGDRIGLIRFRLPFSDTDQFKLPITPGKQSGKWQPLEQGIVNSRLLDFLLRPPDGHTERRTEPQRIGCPAKNPKAVRSRIGGQSLPHGDCLIKTHFVENKPRRVRFECCGDLIGKGRRGQRDPLFHSGGEAQFR